MFVFTTACCGSRLRSAVVVFIVTTEPGPRLVAPTWRAVEPLVHAPKAVQPACVRRVGVIDDAVPERDRAHPRPLARVRVHVGSSHSRKRSGPVGCRARRYFGEGLLVLVVVFD